MFFMVIYVTLIYLIENENVNENVSFYYYWSAIFFFIYEF